MTNHYEETLRLRKLGEQFAAIVENQFTIDYAGQLEYLYKPRLLTPACLVALAHLILSGWVVRVFKREGSLTVSARCEP